MSKVTEGGRFKKAPIAWKSWKAKSATAPDSAQTTVDPDNSPPVAQTTVDPVSSPSGAQAPKSYHLWLNEEVRGPYTVFQLKSMWGRGQITIHNRYTKNAGETWHHLSDIIAELERTIEADFRTPAIIPQATQPPPSYYLWLDEAAIGPFSKSKLQSMWTNHQITAETFYSIDAGNNWCDMSDIIADLEPILKPATDGPHYPPSVESNNALATSFTAHPTWSTIQPVPPTKESLAIILWNRLLDIYLSSLTCFSDSDASIRGLIIFGLFFPLVIVVYFLASCLNNALHTSPSSPTILATGTPLAVPIPPKPVKVDLRISDMGVDDERHLQVTVKNLSGAAIELINIAWLFYDKDGNPIKVHDSPLDGQPLIVVTSNVRNAESRVVNAGGSKTYLNTLITVDETFKDDLKSVAFADLSINARRSELTANNLYSDIDHGDSEACQVLQSPRFPLTFQDPTQEQVAEEKQGPSTITHDSILLSVKAPSQQELTILLSALKKAQEGRATEMTPEEMDAFRHHGERIDAEQQNNITRARANMPARDVDIYNFMKGMWDQTDSLPGGYTPSRDDAPVLEAASQKFHMTQKQALDIYLKVDGAGMIGNPSSATVPP